MKCQKTEKIKILKSDKTWKKNKMNQAKEENLEKPVFRFEMGWSH